MSQPEVCMWHEVRQFTSPVYAKDVPNLLQHLKRSTTVLYLAVAFLIVPSFTLSFIWMDLPSDFLLSWMPCLWLFAVGSIFIKDMKAVAFMQGVATAAWILFFASLSLFPQTKEMMTLTFCTPLATAIMTPHRPSFFVIQGLVLFGVRSMAHLLWLEGDLDSLSWIASASFVVTVLCCFGVQVTRQFLYGLHQTRRQLIAADRLSTLGQHTAGIAHELKTPIASAMLEVHNLGSLMEELGQSIGHPEVDANDLREIHTEMDDHIRGLNSGLERVASFVQSMRQHTQQMHHHQVTTFTMDERIQAVLHLMRHKLKTSSVVVDTSGIPEFLRLRGDAGKLEQVLINLISNAIEACEESGRGDHVWLSAYEEGGETCLVVKDNGPGVPLQLQEKIFEPLFTTRGQSKGTGLGLAVCRDIIQGVFGGTLVLVPGEGGQFEIRIPKRGGKRTTLTQKSFTPFAHEQSSSTLH